MTVAEHHRHLPNATVAEPNARLYQAGANPDLSLDAARDLKLLSKGEAKALHGLLSKRNECAHPSGYKPGLNEVIGYIAELLNRIPTIGQRSV